jgi:hypothetical protein
VFAVCSITPRGRRATSTPSTSAPGSRSVPVAKTNDKAPDYWVYASGSGRYRTEIGAGWSQVAKAERFLPRGLSEPEIRLAGIPSLSWRMDRLNDARPPPILPEIERARLRAGFQESRQNRFPRAPLRGACGVVDPAHSP